MDLLVLVAGQALVVVPVAVQVVPAVKVAALVVPAVKVAARVVPAAAVSPARQPVAVVPVDRVAISVAERRVRSVAPVVRFVVDARASARSVRNSIRCRRPASVVCAFARATAAPYGWHAVHR